MSPGHYKVLRRQSMEMLYHVWKFVKKESEEGLQIPLIKVQKRTAAVANVSLRTVQRISSIANSTTGIPVFETPFKKKRGVRRVTDISSFNEGAIRRCVHNFHLTDKELPTLKLLRKKLKAENIFDGSVSTLNRLLKEIGFRWKKTLSSRRREVIIEQSSLRLQRIEYLSAIAKYRAEGRHIVYTDETYIDSPLSKGERIVIVHAASKLGFITPVMLMFNSSITKAHEFQSRVNCKNYEKWIRSQLIPSLPPNSVVVVDHDSSFQIPTPTSTSTKIEMQSWLRERNIEFDETMLKPQLYKLIAQNKERFKKYSADDIFTEKNHSVLRLPRHHSDLNPMQLAFTELKQYITEEIDDWNVNAIMALVLNKLKEMGEKEWEAFCQRTMKLEEEYRKNEVVIDEMTDEFACTVGGDESDAHSDQESETSEEEDSEDSEGEPPAKRAPPKIQNEGTSKSTTENESTSKYKNDFRAAFMKTSKMTQLIANNLLKN